MPLVFFSVLWSGTYLNSALPSLKLTTEILSQISNSHKGVEFWAESINDFGNLGHHFPCARTAKILAAIHERALQAMTRFVIKIEKLSHIMEATPILEMARAYGILPDYGS